MLKLHLLFLLLSPYLFSSTELGILSQGQSATYELTCTQEPPTLMIIKNPAEGEGNPFIMFESKDVVGYPPGNICDLIPLIDSLSLEGLLSKHIRACGSLDLKTSIRDNGIHISIVEEVLRAAGISFIRISNQN